MDVRVTNQTQSNNAIGYLRRQQAAQAKYEDQVSSGIKLKRPSDDPGRYPALAQAKADALRFDTYAGTMADATTTLNGSAGALGEANTVLTRARQIGLEAVNSSTDPQGYAALASEVDGLISRMVAAGNTQVDGGYVFGGTRSDTPPFAAVTGPTGLTAVTYQGATDRARALIGPNQTVDTRYDGADVFQRAGAGAFASLIGLRDALRDPAVTGPAKSAAVTAQLAQVEKARDAVGDATAEQASSLATLDSLKTRMTDLSTTANARVGELEGTDYVEAVVRMKELDTAMQATMAVTAKILSPSLLDFIR